VHTVAKHKKSASHLVFNVGLLVLVQVNLEEPGSVQPDPDPLAHDFGGVDEVVEDGVVHGDERARPGPLLLLLVALSGKRELFMNAFCVHLFRYALLTSWAWAESFAGR
jgi:hypothetical protein